MNLDYLAGLIDGEASFIIVFKKDRRYRTGVRVFVRFSLPQKERWVLEQVREFLGGIGNIYWHSRDKIRYGIMK